MIKSHVGLTHYRGGGEDEKNDHEGDMSHSTRV